MAHWSDIDFFSGQTSYIEKLNDLVDRAEAVRTLADSLESEVVPARLGQSDLDSGLDVLDVSVAARQTYLEGDSTFDKDDPVQAKQVVLNSLSSTLSSSINITKVFVYDTRLDSDGGQWRKKCQGTGWFQEQLNTAVRGRKRQFPAVVALVGETGRLVIYDLTEPTFPMWMVCTAASSGKAIRSSVSALCAIQGKILVGHAGLGFIVLDFAKDDNYLTDQFNTYHSDSIANREAREAWSVKDASRELVGDDISDISAKVLEVNAVDTATGLAIPTVAVANDAGVSVILSDDSIVDVTDSTYEFSKVVFDGQGGLWCWRNVSSYRAWYINPIPIVNTALSAEFYVHESTVPALLASGATPPQAMADGAFGNSNGVTLIKVDAETGVSSAVAYITRTMATPFMVGDVELCLTGEDLMDESVGGTSITDNGSATFTEVATGTSLEQTTASGGTITATITTGGEFYGWEKVSGVWYFRRTRSDWAGISESGGLLTIQNNTVFTRLVCTVDTPTDRQLDMVEALDRSLFADGAQHLLAGSSDSITDLERDPITDQLHVVTSYGRSTFSGLVRSDEAATTIGTHVGVSSSNSVVVEAGATGAIVSIPQSSVRDQLNRAQEGSSSSRIQQFDQDSGASQTDFWLDPGWRPVSVSFSASGNRSLVPKDDYTLTSDESREGVVFDSAPTSGTVGILAERISG